MQAHQFKVKYAVLAALAAVSMSTAQAASFDAPTDLRLQLSADLFNLLGASTVAAGVGGASYDSATRTLTESLASVSLTNSSAADLVGAGSFGAGLSLSSGATVISLSNLSYSNVSKSVSAIMTINGAQQFSGVLLTADGASVTESFNAATGQGLLTTGKLNLTTAAATSLLGAFGISGSFYTNIATGTDFGRLTIDVTAPFVAVPAIPEPSTYALMGLGLVGIGFAARRRRAV